MNGAFFIGATGLRAQERALVVAANNIANMNTPAFKRSDVRFREMLALPTADGSQSLSFDRAFGLSGVAAVDAARVFSQGELRQTGAALDLAIDGDGFIELLGPDGQSLLWRGGSLSVDAEGLLAGGGGLPLRALITIPEGASELVIDRSGVVSALLDGDQTPTELGRIDLAMVRRSEDLTPVGDGLYQLAEGRDQAGRVPGEDGAGALVQGAIEASNVELSNEMVLLLLMQRGYAASAQALQAGDQLMAIANGLRR